MKPRLAMAALCLVACGPAAPISPTLLLRPPSTLEHDFMARQELTVSPERGEPHTFQGVLQKRGNTLTLLALTPFGTRAFAVEQHGHDVRSQSYVDQPLPMSPEHIIADVNCALFPYFGAPSSGTSEREANVGGVIVFERWLNGYLVERRLHERDPGSSDAIVVRYEYGSDDRLLPVRIELANSRLRYSIAVLTLEETPF